MIKVENLAARIKQLDKYMAKPDTLDDLRRRVEAVTEYIEPPSLYWALIRDLWRAVETLSLGWDKRGEFAPVTAKELAKAIADSTPGTSTSGHVIAYLGPLYRQRKK